MSLQRRSSRRSTCYRYPSDLTDRQWEIISASWAGRQGHGGLESVRPQSPSAAAELLLNKLPSLM